MVAVANSAGITGVPRANVSVNPANQIAAGRLRQAEELLSAMRGDKPKTRKPRKKAEAADVG